MKSLDFFTAERLAPGVTVIRGLAGEYCYLIEGQTRALLLDTLTGIGDLAAFVATLTRLPLSVVNTHGHFDHAGGNYSFEEYYIHPRDAAFMQESCTVENRLRFAETGRAQFNRGVPWKAADLVPQRDMKSHPLHEGQRFALGRRTLEVLETPGHTKGSVCLLDREHRQLFLGDCCNTNTLLCLEGSTTVEEYAQSLQKLLDLQGAYDTCFICHEDTPLPAAIIAECLECCGDILARRDDAEPGEMLGAGCLYARRRYKDGRRRDGGLANIAYREENIYKATSQEAI